MDEWRFVWAEKLFDGKTPINEIVEWAKQNDYCEIMGTGNRRFSDAGLIITEPAV